MRNIEFAELEILHAVATHGGITHAAHALHRVPSNITTRIKQLETRLGVSLLKRKGRGITLTSEGEILLSYAERLLRLADEAESAVKSGHMLGTLRLGSLESAAGARLPPILAHYNQLYPDVRIELITGTTYALIARLMRHEIEAAFVSDPFSAPGMIKQHVFGEELVIISGKRFPPIYSPATLEHTTLIAFAHGCSYRHCLEEWLGSAHIKPDRILEFTSYPAIVACVAAGSGIGIVPRSILMGLQASTEIRQHSLPPHLRYNQTSLLRHPGPPSRALNALSQLLPTPDTTSDSPPDLSSGTR